MKPTRKRVSLTEMIGDAETALHAALAQPITWIATARTRLQHLPKTNFELGCRFAEQGALFDASLRFRITLLLAPDYPHAWYHLGCCYYRLGKTEKAKHALQKALLQGAEGTHASYMLATLDASALPAGQRPSRMPPDLVIGFFTSMAAGYDIEEATRHYHGGKAMHELLAPLLTTPTPSVLDLGCGTGIAARPWRAAAREITGIDLTPAMVSLASKATHAERPLFDRLLTGDLVHLPASIPSASIDLALMVNVSPYLGALEDVFAHIAQRLAPGGLLALTLEPFTGPGYGLVAATSRFGHSTVYAKDAAAQAGLELRTESAVTLYPHTPITALVFGKA